MTVTFETLFLLPKPNGYPNFHGRPLILNGHVSVMHLTLSYINELLLNAPSAAIQPCFDEISPKQFQNFKFLCPQHFLWKLWSLNETFLYFKIFPEGKYELQIQKLPSNATADGLFWKHCKLKLLYSQFVVLHASVNSKSFHVN